MIGVSSEHFLGKRDGSPGPHVSFCCSFNNMNLFTSAGSFFKYLGGGRNVKGGKGERGRSKDTLFIDPCKICCRMSNGLKCSTVVGLEDLINLLLCSDDL